MVEEIDESFQKVTVEDISVDADSDDSVSEEELACENPGRDKPFPATPRKEKQGYHHGKHSLTPESKLAAETKPKRLAKQVQYSNPSSKQCTERRTKMSEEIHNFVVAASDSSAFIIQSELMNILDLTDVDKNQLTRCVTAVFPNCVKKTIISDGKKQVVYTNISLKPNTLSTASVAKELFVDSTNELQQLQKQVAGVEQLMLQDWEVVVEKLNANNIPEANTAVLRYQCKLEQYINLNHVLVKLYEKELAMVQKMNWEHQVTSSQKQQISRELKELERFCCLGLRADGDIEGVINEKIFPRLLENVEENCPLIFSLLQTFLISDERKRIHKTPEYKLKCGVNSLALLLSVRNQKLTNDVRLLFGLLCITYGAGKQFINMLNSIGISSHWDTLISFLDKRLDQLNTSVKEKCVDSTPVILLMDNINIYRGKKRHDRLFTELGPKMWNFTGRAAIIPNLSDIIDLFSCKETTTHPQVDITDLQPKDILLDSMPEHKMLWSQWCDRYYLELLDKTLNNLPTPPKTFTEMSEAEIHNWLQNTNLEDCKKNNYKIRIPEVEEFCKNTQDTEKTDVINLPLSIEDNSTLTGTASILDKFAKEFSIPHENQNAYIDFDKDKKKFDLKSARERYLFMKSIQIHHAEMKEFEKQLESKDKEIELFDIPLDDTESNLDEDETEDDSQASGLSDDSLKHKDADDKFSKLLNKLVDLAQQTVNSSDDSILDKIVYDLSKKSHELNTTRDKFERTVLHAAIENKQYTLANILLACGINPNAKEGCGATPLSLAVLNANINFCKLLVTNFAEFQGEMFGSFPSPLEMAEAMDLNEIKDLFKASSQHLEFASVSILQNGRPCSPIEDRILEEEMCDSDIPTDFTYKRSKCKEFPTAIVGDVGTCKNNRSVKNRNVNAYGWSTEIPGDMHAKGFLCEAVFKAHGTGGFHKLVNVVMKRPKLTKEAFKKRKFQDQNLNKIKEGVRDASQSYGMAAVTAFKKSTFFPSINELKKTMQKSGDHNHILLQRFKEWLKDRADNDESHLYHQQLFTLFGPLLALFIVAGKYGDGNLREIVWVILLPIFAQLGFRNYWTEAFVHVTNFTALWPLAFRQMMKNNSTVNLSGKTGHNVDLDEYVETYIVRPLKTYVTGHTSVQMCRRLMGNLNLFGSTRSSYSSKQAFDCHPTTKHKEQSALPDQIKGMWFCIKNNFFEVSGSKVPFQYPLQNESHAPKPVPKMFISVRDKGERKITEKFESKLHDCFPDFRKFSFERVSVDAD